MIWAWPAFCNHVGKHTGFLAINSPVLTVRTTESLHPSVTMPMYNQYVLCIWVHVYANHCVCVEQELFCLHVKQDNSVLKDSLPHFFSTLWMGGKIAKKSRCAYKKGLEHTTTQSY